MFRRRLNKNISHPCKRMCLLSKQVSKAKSQEKRVSQHGQRLQSSKKKRRNKRLTNFLNSHMNLIMTNIWRIKKSNLLLKSSRIELVRSRRIRTGKSKWPRNGMMKKIKAKWTQLPRCKPNPSELQISRVCILTVSKSKYLYFLIEYLITGSTKSKASYMQQVKQAKKAEKEKSEWDRSTVISEVPRTLEDKVASRIANQMLKENPQFKGIHSNMSIKKILEKEAKR